MSRTKNEWDYYPDWGALEPEDLQPILRKWQDLLQQPKPREESLHAFLGQQARLAFRDNFNFCTVLSKIRLGADLVTDFIVIYDQWSDGIRYKFIEIEKPQTVPFTKEGIPSSGLSRAIQQVLSWRQWLDERVSEACRLFPSYRHIFDLNASFDFEIIIGTRKNSEPWLDRRQILSKSLGISIRSFDSITPRLTQTMGFEAFSSIGDEKDFDLDTRSQLACPFIRAFTDSDWREMVRESHRGSSHFMNSYGKLLVKYQRENDQAAHYRRLLRRRELNKHQN